MSKLKIEHGASKVNLVLLKTNIEDAISQDIDLLATWSDNDRKYIVNELLRFALTQEEEFQRYKIGLPACPPKPDQSTKPVPPAVKIAPEAGPKSDLSSTTRA